MSSDREILFALVDIVKENNSSKSRSPLLCPFRCILRKDRRVRLRAGGTYPALPGTTYIKSKFASYGGCENIHSSTSSGTALGIFAQISVTYLPRPRSPGAFPGNAM